MSSDDAYRAKVDISQAALDAMRFYDLGAAEIAYALSCVARDYMGMVVAGKRGDAE